MKKLICLLLTLLILTSCQEKVFSLDDEYYFKTDLIEIDSLEEVEQMAKDKKSFALFVYMNGCTSCAAFKPVLTAFLNRNKMTFYSISAETIGEDKDNSIMKAIEYAPSVLLYNKGKVVASLDAMSNDDIPYYETEDGFTQWFIKYCEIKIQ